MNESQKKYARKTLVKVAATGLVGIILTIGVIKLTDSDSLKSTIGAAGLAASGIAAYYQFVRAARRYDNSDY